MIDEKRLIKEREERLLVGTNVIKPRTENVYCYHLQMRSRSRL